jgi:hypothetical protein
MSYSPGEIGPGDDEANPSTVIHAAEKRIFGPAGNRTAVVHPGSLVTIPIELDNLYVLSHDRIA